MGTLMFLTFHQDTSPFLVTRPLATRAFLQLAVPAPGCGPRAFCLDWRLLSPGLV